MKSPRHVTFALVASCLLLAGCTLSLNPIYTDQDLIYDPALVGTWAGDTHEDGGWTFTRLDEGNTYRLVVKIGKGAAHFKASLVQLGQRRFLDLFPDEDAHEQALARAGLDDAFRGSYVPGHWIYQVVRLDQELRLAELNDDWVKALLKREPGATPHSRLSEDHGRVVLTGSTAELQAFLLRYADSPEAFKPGQPAGLKRQPAAQP
jgi:hypothetical protein